MSSCYECAYSRPGLISDECSGYYCELHNCPLSAISDLDPELGDPSCFCEGVDHEN